LPKHKKTGIWIKKVNKFLFGVKNGGINKKEHIFAGANPKKIGY